MSRVSIFPMPSSIGGLRLIDRPALGVETYEMTMEDEQIALETVVARLAARYPAASREHVEHVVREEHEALAGPIRDYIPILVEHQAKGRLRDSLSQEINHRQSETTGLPAGNPA